MLLSQLALYIVHDIISIPSTQIKAVISQWIFGDTHTLSKMTIICSMAGCEQQQFHFDFFQRKRIDEAKTPIPYLMIIPLERTLTGLGLLDENKTAYKQMLEFGYIYIGRYDLLHCGADCSRMNIRIHFYLDPKKAKLNFWRKEDTNYFGDGTLKFERYKRFYDARKESGEKCVAIKKQIKARNEVRCADMRAVKKAKRQENEC